MIIETQGHAGLTKASFAGRTPPLYAITRNACVVEKLKDQINQKVIVMMMMRIIIKGIIPPTGHYR